MVAMTHNRWLVVFAITAATCLFVSATGFAGDKKAEKKAQAEALAGIGIDMEAARLQPLSERGAAIQDLEGRMKAWMDAGIPSEQKTAARFLWAEIQYALGNHSESQKQFAKAEKQGKKGPFADDAAFLEIIAIESEGRDEEAAKAWLKWRKKYADSPLMSDALLAESWNALRRDTLSEAKKTLAELQAKYPYLSENPRVTLTTAAVAYMDGRPNDALSILPPESSSAAAAYLRALCYEAEGVMLKAAANYQEVADRFAESPLRDHAMLAKANVFLSSAAYRSAAEEFEQVAEHATLPAVRAEAELRRSACVFLDGDVATGTDLMQAVTVDHRGTDHAARAQLLLGEALVSQSNYEDAIVAFNRVLTDYFEHSHAASAQYRVGRCLDAMGRHADATTAYQMVVSGYSLSPQSPAAAYLAGVGLLEQEKPQAAVPYFQLVLDRYARSNEEGTIVFSSPEHGELVEASLCLLELSYHRTGNMGQLSGVPHLMLLSMPPSTSPWRAYSMLIDADALAAQGRYDDAQGMLEKLMTDFPSHDAGIAANRLLAWTYAQQGQDDLAIETEERMLARYASHGDLENLSSAYLNKAHILFNRKEYNEAATTYDEFLHRFPDHPQTLLALYQTGLSHLRLEQNGDAVDRWETLVTMDPAAEISERAWVRAGDLYFQTEHYDDAKRCYQGLLDNFSASRAAALGTLRIAQCEYNAGNDAEALGIYSDVVASFPGTGIAREAERGIELALYRLGQSEDGDELLAELVERYPTSSFAADAQFEIAMRQYNAKEYAQSAEEFRRVVSQFPNYSAADKAHFLMADAYTRAEAMTDARLAYEQFLKFFPESELRAQMSFHLGSLQFDEGDYMRAAVNFTEVLDAADASDFHDASLFNLALCQRMLGAELEAQTLFERYRAAHPDGDERTAQVAHQLADIHDQAGRTKEAALEYERALASKPSKVLAIEINYRLGVCYETLDNNAAALKAYNKAIASKKRSDAFRLSAVARLAALHEHDGNYKKAIGAYRDLIANATDPELVIAAKERAAQLEAVAK